MSNVIPFHRPAPQPRKRRRSKKHEIDVITTVIEEHAERLKHSGERILALIAELRHLEGIKAPRS
jgi:hypothetical protein